MERIELKSTVGHWWHRLTDNTFHRNLFLGDWDSSENYQQVTDIEKELDSEDLTDTETLDIILNR